jgi:hypothetical protein
VDGNSRLSFFYILLVVVYIGACVVYIGTCTLRTHYMHYTAALGLFIQWLGNWFRHAVCLARTTWPCDQK